jgi:hypothetical protein
LFFKHNLIRHAHGAQLLQPLASPLVVFSHLLLHAVLLPTLNLLSALLLLRRVRSLAQGTHKAAKQSLPAPLLLLHNLLAPVLYRGG